MMTDADRQRHRRFELLGFIAALALIVTVVSVSTHEPPEPVRKFGPQAWEPEFRPNRGELK